MTYLDYLDTAAIEVASSIPRISVWDTDTVKRCVELDTVSEEDGEYGKLPASSVSHVFIFIFL